MKKSLIIYSTDWDALTDVNDPELGAIMRQVFDYAFNGTIPTNPSIGFKFMKTHIDADNKKYQETCQKRSEAAHAKYAKTTNASNCMQMEANASKRCNLDYDIDIDIDNDIDIISSSSTSKEKDKKESILLTDQAWREAVCMKHHISLPELDEHIGNFHVSNACRGIETHMDARDLKAHFDSWLSIALDKRQKATKKGKSHADRLDEQAANLRSIEQQFYASINQQ